MEIHVVLEQESRFLLRCEEQGGEVQLQQGTGGRSEHIPHIKEPYAVSAQRMVHF